MKPIHKFLVFNGITDENGVKLYGLKKIKKTGICSINCSGRFFDFINVRRSIVE